MWFCSPLVFILPTLIHSGEADSSIQSSAAKDVHGSVNVTFDFGNRLEQAEAFLLTVRKDFKREPLLRCDWIITDRTGQDNACHATEGYTSPGIQDHRLTLTIPKASGKDSGHYTFCMRTDIEKNSTCKSHTVAVVEVNEGEADSSIQSSTATDVHGSANVTFYFGNRLEQAQAYVVLVRKDFKRKHLLQCHWSFIDGTGQENACHGKEGYTSPGIQDHRLTLTILKASGKDSGNYIVCVCTDFEEKPTCETYAVTVVEVNKDTASYASISSSAIAIAEPNMVVIIIIAVVVLTVVLVH